MDRLYVINNHYMRANGLFTSGGLYVFCSNNLFVSRGYKVIELRYHPIEDKVEFDTDTVKDFVSYCDRACEALLIFSKKLNYRIVLG